MQPREEGFQQTQQDHLLPKQRQKGKQQLETNPYFVIPDAKPLLSKSYIDMNKPKVLIRQIPFKRQPLEILNGKHYKDFTLGETGSINSSPKKGLNVADPTTIWAKYVLSQNYQCLYLKYYKGSVVELVRRGAKKFRLELQKLSQYSQYVFSTYIVDLGFLNEIGNYLLRNLQECTLEDVAKEEADSEVQFDSRFQCGNLYAAFQKNNTNPNKNNIYQYDLILQTDINTKGYSNWFYFSIKSKTKRTFKLNIVNMQKSYSLFNMGMKVAVFSKQKFSKDKIEWHREGYDIVYSRNDILKDKDSNERLNTLSFSIEQKYDDDIIFIAMNYPYSYSKLLRYLDNIEKIAKLNSHIYFKRQSLSKTISSNICPVITLTWKRDKKVDESKRRKKIIGVIARQHPCETVSSYVMEGFINSLVYLKNQNCVELLKRFIFKIVPMTNIDGVVYGNSRCDINGNDINRKWIRNPNTFLYPVVASIKALFSRLTSEGYEIEHFFDLHGHSRKMGSFIYGCRTYDDIESRQFAWIMSKINTKFRFEDCSFGLSNFKKETARGVMSNMVVDKKSTTLECSFFGYRTANGNKHFETKDLQDLGESLVEALYNEQVKPEGLIDWESIRLDIKNYLKDLSKKSLDSDSESEGSDSDPEGDQFTEKEKTQAYLNPQTAAKIGLTELIVASRTNSPRKHPRKKSSDIVQAFRDMDQIENSHNVESILAHRSSGILSRNYASQSRQKLLPFRESRSITKITPFKFTQRSRNKSQNDFKERIRIAIDICHMKPEQKLSAPTLPSVNPVKGNKFWTHLNKEYESLLAQKQDQIILKKSMKSNNF